MVSLLSVLSSSDMLEGERKGADVEVERLMVCDGFTLLLIIYYARQGEKLCCIRSTAIIS